MKKSILFAIGILFILAACTPIENRETAGPLLTTSDLSIDIHQTTTGGNQVVLKNSTTGVFGSWDYVAGTSIKLTDTVLLPFLGNIPVTYYATTSGGVVKYQKIMPVTTIDHPLDTMWSDLAGSTSKTWVWATDIPGGVCYGNGGYQGCNAPCWWTCKAADLAGWGVLNDKMTFDLFLKANYTLVTGNTSADGKPAGTYKGIFTFDAKTRIKLGDGSDYTIGVITPGDVMSRGFQPNLTDDNGKRPNIFTYNLLKLNANQMYLMVPEPGVGAWGTAWFWMFKQQGYSYPTK
jgi:hypothetical protein